MECPNCHTENRTTARFCAACGSSLPEGEPAAVVEPVAGSARPVETITPSTATDEQPTARAAMTTGAESEEAVQPDAEAGEPDQSPADDEPIGETSEATADEGEVAGDAEKAVEAGLTPLPAGTLLADRYEIVELMSSDADGNVYSALDLARCAICDFDGNAPGDEYCGDCGAALVSPPACQIREQPELEEPEAVARFSSDGRAYAVLARDTGAAEPEPALPRRTRLQWAAKTDPGQVRELNEDCVDVHVYTTEGGPTLGLFVVADGVGGQAAGEVASQLATQVIWEKIRETMWLPELRGEAVLSETMEMRVEEAVQAANQAVYRQRTEQANDMGTTTTLALLRDNVAVVANVGDSRTYLWNADGLQPLTVDHSLVQSLVEAGEV